MLSIELAASNVKKSTSRLCIVYRLLCRERDGGGGEDFLPGENVVVSITRALYYDAEKQSLRGQNYRDHFFPR